LAGEAEQAAERADGQPAVADAQRTEAVAEQAEEQAGGRPPGY
jgi:hypothetical protein